MIWRKARLKAIPRKKVKYCQMKSNMILNFNRDIWGNLLVPIALPRRIHILSMGLACLEMKFV
jgi:hypothetical protein